MHEESDFPVYEILSDLTGLKFKSQLKNSGIEFDKILKVINLESNKESYFIGINGKQIMFSNRSEFLIQFISLLESNLKAFEIEFQEVQEESKNIFSDETAIFYEHERIGLHGSKQRKLLEKMRGFQGTK